ncbi:MAG: hypothetical protein NWF00_01350 [Candidatus Bathyarchaeota archaeon]|nr:hypothetical protein [Candidatus Bathyarchaeota archaeon]
MFFTVKSQQTSDSADKEAAQKILRSVSYEHGFHFFDGVGNYTGETAVSLFSFTEELKTMATRVVRFHFRRGDYQKWISQTLGDEELAHRIHKIESAASDDALKKKLLVVLQIRLEELNWATKT